MFLRRGARPGFGILASMAGLLSFCAGLLWFNVKLFNTPILLDAVKMTPTNVSTLNVDRDFKTKIFTPKKLMANSYDTLERPIFSNTRRPQEILKLSKRPSRDKIIPGFQRKAIDRANTVLFSLQGVIVNENIRKAFIVGPELGDGKWFKQGEKLKSWTIKYVDYDRIILTVGPKQLELMLFPPKHVDRNK